MGIAPATLLSPPKSNLNEVCAPTAAVLAARTMAERIPLWRRSKSFMAWWMVSELSVSWKIELRPADVRVWWTESRCDSFCPRSGHLRRGKFWTREKTVAWRCARRRHWSQRDQCHQGCRPFNLEARAIWFHLGHSWK